MRKFLKNIRSSHAKAPFFSDQRHLGLVLATIGWCTLSGALTLFPNTVPVFNAAGTVNFFFFHLSITTTFFLFGLPYGLSFFTCHQPKLVLLRGIISEVLLFSFIYSKIWSPESKRFLVYTIDPIWAALMIFITRSKITKLSWSGIFLSIIGVCVMFYSCEHTLGDLKTFSYGVSAGILVTLSILVTHSLIKTEHTCRIGFYQGIIGCIFSLGILIFHTSTSSFQLPPLHEIALSLFFGVIYSFALFCFIQSAFYVESYVIRITSYSLILFKEFLNWTLAKHAIAVPSMVGIALIVFGGVKVVLGTFSSEKEGFNKPTLPKI